MASDAPSAAPAPASDIPEWDADERPAAPAPADDAPIEVGTYVELHSLSVAELNGKRGFCALWQKDKERWSVQMPRAAKAGVAVRPANIRRAPAASAADAEAAKESAVRAAALLAEARASKADELRCIAEASTHLDAAEARDPANPMMLQLRGDLAHMKGGPAAMAMYMRRAVANNSGGASKEYEVSQRMGLANALGEQQDLDGELEQLQRVLRLSPNHIHARFALGQCLMLRGLEEHALPEFFMALTLPNDDPPLGEAMVQGLRQHARDSITQTLGKKSAVDAAAARHSKAAEVLHTLLAVPGLDPDSIAKAEANLACAYARQGKLDEAELAAARGTAANAPTAAIKAATICAAAGCKEHRADVASEASEKVTLLEAAKALYRRAHQVQAHNRSAQGFERAAAKADPDFEWVTDPSRPGAMHDAGSVRALRQGAVLETMDSATASRGGSAGSGADAPVVDVE